MAGVTTFVVMSYIIFVNPIILTGATPKFGPTLAFSARPDEHLPRRRRHVDR